MRGAIEGAEVVILSIPLPAVAELPMDLFANVPGNVVVIDAGKPESVRVRERIGRPVVEAFNTILAELSTSARPRRGAGGLTTPRLEMPGPHEAPPPAA